VSETDLSRAITKTLRALGYIVIRIQSGKLRIGMPGRERWVELAEKGCPDRVVLGPAGTVTWLEVKTASGRLTREQKAWHARAQGLGHRVRTVRSIEQALAAVRQIRHRPGPSWGGYSNLTRGDVTR
jgi:hypothetical protein